LADSFRDLVAEAESIIVVTHERPDADAVGSLLSMSLALEERGIRSVPVLLEGLPNRYGFLPGSPAVVAEPPAEADLLIVVDCSDFERTGFLPGAFPRTPDVNIDHHPTNTAFAALNLVQTKAAATTQILYSLFVDLGWPLSGPVATNLMAGLISDTIGFRTSSVTPETFHVATELMKVDIPYVDTYANLINRRSFDALRYWGAGLSKVQQRDGLIWTTLTLEDRLAAGYAGSGDADLVDILTTISGAEMVLVFVEQTEARVKVSWRSLNGVDVSRLAERFGGGGHAPAAGATLDGELPAVMAEVLKATQGAMENRKVET
jgi:phosphoesterase RecJ-like protein